MSENLETMTVAELRKLAKENDVKLPAGIDKKGIIEKIRLAIAPKEAPQEQVQASPAPAAVTVPIRKASIIADDDEDQDDYDSVPVYSASPVFRAPVKDKAEGGQSSLSTISSKAPAFTMEGARAWHNPRSYSPAPPPQNYARTQWSTKPINPPPSHPSPARQEQSVRASSLRADPVNTLSDKGAQAAPRCIRDSFMPAGELDAETLRQSEFARREQMNEPKEEPEEPAPLTPETLLNVSCDDAEGILEIMPEGFGFLRGPGLLPDKNDVYISISQIKRFSLRKGDLVKGKTRARRENEPYRCMLYITDINTTPVDDMPTRPAFDSLTGIYPKKKFSFTSKEDIPASVRIADLLSPIGYGQRAMIIVPSAADRNAVLKDFAKAVKASDQQSEIIYIALDETPETITELKQGLQVKTVFTVCSDPCESTVKVCDLICEHAMRMAEQKKHTVILLNSINRLAAAYNACAPQSSRTLPNGLCGFALNGVKKFFGAARNIKEGGSITVIAAADADSPLTTEISASANMTLTFDPECLKKKLASSVLLSSCQSKRPELLMSSAEIECRERLSALISKYSNEEALSQLIFMFEKAPANNELCKKLQGWLEMLGV